MLNLAGVWTPPVQQQNFRALLDAMSRPGLITTIESSDQHPAYLGVLAALLDGEVSLADTTGSLSQQDWTLLQTQQAAVSSADYILSCGKQPLAEQPKLGTLPSPELSATLVIRVESLGEGELFLHLSGPGIRFESKVRIGGLNTRWLAQRETWRSAFPLGVDIILVDDNQALALPRTTNVEVI